MDTRIESDTMGTIEVAADRYWGAQTERSRRQFAIGQERFSRPFLRALGLVKRSAARANAELGVLDGAKAQVIDEVADELIAGHLDDHFPLVVWQTGSGTQTNMNANEVIANRAIEKLGGVLGTKEPIHPNDDVNRSQSSNDVIPTTAHVSGAEQLQGALVPSLRALQASLEAKAQEFRGLVKLGRTHLMDATPLRVEDEWATFARQVELATDGVARAAEGLLELPIGGTAVGSGLHCPPGFDERVADELAAATGLGFFASQHKAAGIAAHDAIVAAHGSLRVVAVALNKIANDVRLLGSGPRGGLAELILPANEPGSSIMPGKVNPTQCEALAMVCAQVMGHDVAVGIAGSSGHLQLNTYKPLLAHDLLISAGWLRDASESFRVQCVDGLQVDAVVTRRHLERSLMLVTALAPEIGYDAAARVAKKALAEGTTLREAALALGTVSPDTFDRLTDPARMVGPDPDDTN